MGSCYWSKTRSHDEELWYLSTHTQGNNISQDIHRGRKAQRTPVPFKVTYGQPFLLCWQERWRPMSSLRLLSTQWYYNQERSTATPYPRTHRQVAQSALLHQVWCTLGIQQYPYQGRRWMESSLQNTLRAVWAHSHDIWSLQRPSNLPDIYE